MNKNVWKPLRWTKQRWQHPGWVISWKGHLKILESFRSWLWLKRRSRHVLRPKGFIARLGFWVLRLSSELSCFLAKSNRCWLQIVVGCKLQCFYFPLSLGILREGNQSTRHGTQYAGPWERQREWRHVSSEKLFSWLCHGFIKFILPHVHAAMKSMISCSALLG